MSTVITHLDYLINRHECVVVPGLGAFITRRISAQYDSKHNVFLAPYKEIAFNGEITFDDGLLSASVARRERISIERASGMVAEEVGAMRSQMNADGEIGLGTIGKLIAQEGSATPLFEPYNQLEKQYSLGLYPLEVSELRARHENTDVNTEEVSSNFDYAWRKFAKVAASIAVVIMVGIAAVFPLIENRSDNMASISATLNNFVNSTQTSLYPPVNRSASLMIAVPKKAESLESGLVVELVPEASVVSVDNLGDEAWQSQDETSVASASSSATGLRKTASDKYCLIVASLPTERLAKQFIKENPDYDLDILSRDGKFRVYVATGESTAQALAQKELLGTTFSDAWVCRR